MTTSPLDRALGALAGVHLGDALGARWEFDGPSQIDAADVPNLRPGGRLYTWRAGAATDDTTQTIMVAESLLEANDFVTPAALLGDALVRWFDAGPPDVGTTTARGISKYRRDGVGGAGPAWTGNGSLMRTAPVGIAYRNVGDLVAHATALSAVTHDAPVCIQACVSYALILSGLLDGHPYTQRMDGDVRTLLADGFVASGDVIDTLAVALVAVRDPRPAFDVLCDVVRLGYDTDTNAAVAGGLLGARDGLGAWPGDLLGTLERGPEMALLGGRLLAMREGYDSAT